MIYWHIQMNQPDGRHSLTIDSRKMLEENPPVIGTGEWEDNQCEQFKNTVDTGLQIGDIIVVREGQKPLALCKVSGENFTDDAMQEKYVNVNYRTVEILDWYSENGTFPQPQGTLQRLINNQTESWKFIDSWYRKVQRMGLVKKAVDLLMLKGQVILQGPPGTGKTFAAKDIAEQLVYGNISSDKGVQKERLSETDQFKLVQFHPAFSYEDFVRGIVAKSHAGGIEYLTVDKTLSEFAARANKNYLDSKKPAEEISTEQWIREKFEEFKEDVAEVIDTADSGEYSLNKTVSIIEVESDAFRYTGKKWKYEFRMKYEDIIQLYYHQVSERKLIKLQPYVTPLAQTHTTYFKLLLDKFYEFMKGQQPPAKTELRVSEKKYVLIIDEINRANLPSVLGELIYALEYRNHSVETMYKIDEDGRITIPSNLFIIGTMNTADRSVGHIDYAIRRRFAFINVRPDGTVITDPAAQQLFAQVSKLFEDGKVAPDFNADDVRVGHSYFLAKSQEELALRLEYEIKPILQEYLKDGILLQETRNEIGQLHV